MKLAAAETRSLFANPFAKPLPFAITIANLIAIEPVPPFASSFLGRAVFFASSKHVTILW